MTKKDIDLIARPFEEEEALASVGRWIKKRPGVFNNDDGSQYKIVGVCEGGISFYENGYFHKSYQYDNILYDYVFVVDGFPVGSKR